jgi:hypothetical protein
MSQIWELVEMITTLSFLALIEFNYLIRMIEADSPAKGDKNGTNRRNNPRQNRGGATTLNGASTHRNSHQA